MVGDRGQVAAAAGVGEQHRRAARAEFLCRVAYADPGAVGTAEREDGEALADDGHRSVAHLGGPEGFGVERAGLLELECRFLRRGEAVAAPRSEEYTSELQSLMGITYA